MKNEMIKFKIEQEFKTETSRNKSGYPEDTIKCIAKITAQDTTDLGFRDFTIFCEFNPQCTEKDPNYWFERDSYIEQINDIILITKYSNKIEVANDIKDIIKSEFIKQYDNSLLTVDYNSDLSEEEVVALKDVLHNGALRIYFDVEISGSVTGDMDTTWQEILPYINFEFDKSIAFTKNLRDFSSDEWLSDSYFLENCGIYLDNWYYGVYQLDDGQKFSVATDYFYTEVECELYDDLVEFFSDEITSFFVQSVELDLRAYFVENI